MSTFTQFGGGAPTTSIVNAFSSGGASASSVQAQTLNNAAAVLSGVLTANTLKTVLTVTGGGEVPFLSVYANDTTSRTVRIKVTVDGVSVFDATSNAITVANTGMMVIGIGTSTSYITQAPAPLRFNSSLLVEIASSLSETDKVSIAYTLNKR